jgi:hypothetical protein
MQYVYWFIEYLSVKYLSGIIKCDYTLGAYVG